MVSAALFVAVAALTTWALMTNHPRPVWREPNVYDVLAYRIRCLRRAYMNFGRAVARTVNSPEFRRLAEQMKALER